MNVLRAVMALAALIQLLAVVSSAAAPPLPDQPRFIDVLRGQQAKPVAEPLPGLQIEAEDDTVRIHFRWSAEEDEERRVSRSKRFRPRAFRLYRADVPGMGYLRIAESPRQAGETQRLIDEGAMAERPRYYAIRAVDALGNERELVRDLAICPRDTKRPRRPAPPRPEAEKDAVRLHWTDDFDADVVTVCIYRTDGDDFRFRLLAQQERAAGTSYLDRDVLPERAYLYYLTTRDRAGNESVPSRERLIRLRDDTPPAGPGTLEALAGDSSVLLRFPTVNDRRLAWYRIERVEGELKRSSRFVFLARVEPTDLALAEYHDRGLKNGRSYHYQVRAVDARGNASTPTPVATAVPVDRSAPDPPQKLELIPDNGSVLLRFSESEDRDGDLQSYRIYRQSAVLPAFTLLKVLDAAPTRSRPRKGSKLIGIFEPRMREYRDRGLLNGVEYRYAVSAVDRKGNESARTKALPATPCDRQPPAMVEDFEVRAGIRRVTIRFRRGKDRDLARYRLLRQETQVRGSLEVRLEHPHRPEPTVVELHDDRVEAGVEYAYSIEAVDESGNVSDAVPVQRVKPLFPVQFSASRVYEDNRPVTWLYLLDPNTRRIRAVRSGDYRTWSDVKPALELPGLPPNFCDGARFSCQRIDGGVAVYAYHPATLDLYYNASPDGKAWGGWELLCDELPLPPGATVHTVFAFEQYPDRLSALAWDPLSRFVQYCFARDGRTFRRWRLQAVQVPFPPDFSLENLMALASDAQQLVLFSLRQDAGTLDLSFSFDRLRFRDWYRFSETLKLPEP